MNTKEIIKGIRSKDPIKVWHAAFKMAQHCQNHDNILPLVPYLSEIKSKACTAEMAGSIVPQSPFMEFAIKTLECHRDKRVCPCSLYMALQVFNPTAEEEKGNVKILNIVLEISKEVNYYVARCRKCGQVFEVHERRYPSTWWKWTIKEPDAWTFDDNLDFRSPDNMHRLVYEDLGEVCMGGPLRGECYLETADKQRIKIYDTCGGPPLWQTYGQFVALPIWTEHRNLRLGVVNVTTKELTTFKDPRDVLYLHKAAFYNNVIWFGDYKFDITKKRAEEVIRLV